KSASGVLQLCTEERGRLLLALEADQLPSWFLGEHSAGQLVVERVSRLVRAKRAYHRMAKQVQIAHRVQHLVLDELVLIAQTIRIQHSELVHHYSIVQTPAQAQPLGSHRLDILHEAEGSSPGDLLDVRGVRKIDLDPLTRVLEDRVTECDAEIHAKADMR